MSLRTQVGELLENLRGDLNRTAMARELKMSRQAVMGLERGVVSLERLENLEAAYGVRFVLIALDGNGDEVTLSPRLTQLADHLAATARGSDSQPDELDSAP